MKFEALLESELENITKVEEKFLVGQEVNIFLSENDKVAHYGVIASVSLDSDGNEVFEVEVDEKIVSESVAVMEAMNPADLMARRQVSQKWRMRNRGKLRAYQRKRKYMRQISQ